MYPTPYSLYSRGTMREVRRLCVLSMMTMERLLCPPPQIHTRLPPSAYFPADAPVDTSMPNLKNTLRSIVEGTSESQIPAWLNKYNHSSRAARKYVYFKAFRPLHTILYPAKKASVHSLFAGCSPLHSPLFEVLKPLQYLKTCLAACARTDATGATAMCLARTPAAKTPMYLVSRSLLHGSHDLGCHE